MTTALVTGATGFVGRALCAALLRADFGVIAAVRRTSSFIDCGSERFSQIAVGDIDEKTDWSRALKSVDVVIHLAARVHVMNEAAQDPLGKFRGGDVAATQNLARASAAAGVKRLVYVSSVKVNGEMTPADQKFTEQDVPNPQDAYASAKMESEKSLHEISRETGLELVVVRPPLVYGPRVKGNFLQMLRILSRGIPLPLASVTNRRSLLYVENLADALLACATHPAAAGHTYLVCDNEDISTTDLLRRLAAAMGVPARLFFCPPALLRMLAALFGKSGQIERLLSSLRVDSGKITGQLDWRPPYTLSQGLQATADWYQNTDR